MLLAATSCDRFRPGEVGLSHVAPSALVLRRKLMPPARHCLENPSGELWVESAANLAVPDALPSHLVQPVHEQLAKKYSRWRVAMSLLAIAGPVCSTACMVSGTSLWRWGRCAPMTV